MGYGSADEGGDEWEARGDPEAWARDVGEWVEVDVVDRFEDKVLMELVSW